MKEPPRSHAKVISPRGLSDANKMPKSAPSYDVSAIQSNSRQSNHTTSEEMVESKSPSPVPSPKKLVMEPIPPKKPEKPSNLDLSVEALVDKVNYLEGLVPGLNKRIGDYESLIESMNAELQDLRQQQSDAKPSASPRTVARPPLEKSTSGEDLSTAAGEKGMMQRRPSQVWVGTGKRKKQKSST